jgi:predicted NAD/FAD-dependent oxidoreductase
VACARRLHDAGRAVRILDRSFRLGGRMAVRTELLPDGRRHPVDIGAAYFTVGDPSFAQVVSAWQDAGLARPWTDTFALGGPEGPRGSVTGPVRWAAPGGLRSLVEALAEGLDVRLEHEVEAVGLEPAWFATGYGPGSTAGYRPGPAAGGDRPTVDDEPAAAVVLAMPDPQASDLLPVPVSDGLGISDRSWSPTLAVWAAWPERCWPDLEGMFVGDSPILSWLADDGRRRGDGAAVLVAHTTDWFARQRLDDPGSAIQEVLAELPRVLGVGVMPRPAWARVHRWSLASPRRTHARPFALHPGGIGVCGDAWGPRSRVEQAWLSGDRLGEALVQQLP